MKLGKILRTNPEISAVIPFYGDPADTLELIAQLQAQTIADRIEIVVSDDHSPTPFPQTEGVKVVRRSTNGGFGSNVNTGADAATGEWLFILNSDLSLTPDFAEKALAVARAEGDVLLSPQVLGHDGQSQYVGRSFPSTFQFAWEWFTPLARFRNTTWWHQAVGHDTDCVSGVTKRVDWVMGACMILRRETFERIGGMDERYFMNSEEVDFQRRLKNRGIDRVFAGELTVKHVGGASSGASELRRQWVLNSRYIYSRKWRQGKYLTPALKATTWANFGVNVLRQRFNPAVDARAIKDSELSLINTAESRAR